jgi:hypothetical protein
MLQVDGCLMSHLHILAGRGRESSVYIATTSSDFMVVRFDDESWLY